jgi:two-component system chemotaxis response regulator CheB
VTAKATAKAQTGPLRVLVVDDSATYRRIVCQALAAIAGVEVGGVAPDLDTARSKLAAAPYDVVTIDVTLRAESGLDLLHWLRAHQPGLTAILVTAGQVAGARTEVDALLAGAAGMVLKPQDDPDGTKLSEGLGRVLSGLRRRRRLLHAETADVAPAFREVVVVGASTGGPPVLMKLLQGLPSTFDVPVVIVQHMPAPHVPFLAELLAGRTGRPVTVGRHREPLAHGHVYLAGDARHLLLTRTSQGLTLLQSESPEEHHCRPAVDPLFRSAAEWCGADALGVVISGMGSDGAQGAVALAARGAPVVVQDERTSVVWSMPGAAFAAGAAAAVAPADELADWVVRWTAVATARTGGAAR